MVLYQTGISRSEPTGGLAPALARTVALALKLIPAADGAAIESMNAGYLEVVCAAGSLSAHVGLRLLMEDSLSGLALATGRVLSCADADADQRVERDRCRETGARSLVCVPVRVRGVPVGCLSLVSKRPEAFDERAVEVAGALLDQVRAAAPRVGPTAVEPADGGDGYPERDALAPPVPEAAAVAFAGDEALEHFVAKVAGTVPVERHSVRRRIEAALRPEAVSSIVQPVYQLRTGRLHGLEALARFNGEPYRSPALWFAEGYRVGMGVELELRAAAAALELLGSVPFGARLALNVGPVTASDPRFDDLLVDVDGQRLVLELTETVGAGGNPALAQALQRYRARGVQIAIDHAQGGGFDSVLALTPDYLKLDRSVIRTLGTDRARRKSVAAAVERARDAGSEIVAEGIETPAVLAALTDLGVTYGQGHLLGRPAPVHRLRAAPTAIPLLSPAGKPQGAPASLHGFSRPPVRKRPG